jgi:hypothetical protein
VKGFLISLVPSIGALFLLWITLRAIFQADRRERAAMARLEAADKARSGRGEGPLPDAAVPDAAVPDAAVPDAAVPDAAVPDAAVPDAADADLGGARPAPAGPGADAADGSGRDG